jgi:hypothetical protein
MSRTPGWAHGRGKRIRPEFRKSFIVRDFYGHAVEIAEQ